MSRAKAKETLNLDDYKSSMNGIFTTSVSKDTLDEAPMVYKPMEEIIANIDDTVEIVDIIKPIYNFKSSN
jgi:RNA-splicing ligase RtcB